MSVSPASSRTGWHTSQPAGPGRPPAVLRRPANSGTPSLTVTLSIPLVGTDELTPPARRLLDAALELIERGEGTVTGLSGTGERRAEIPAPRTPARPAGATQPVPALHILVASRSVLIEGDPLPLTRLEFDLLLHLCRQPKRVHRRAALMHQVWGATTAVDTRTVDVHVRRIRRKLGDASAIIGTVRGVGYRVDQEHQVRVEQEL